MPERLEVMPGTWDQLSESGRLFTTAVRTCIAVSIYDSRQKLGFLGHFNPSAFKDGSLKDMESIAEESILEAESTQLWAGGGEMLQEGAKIEGYSKADIGIMNYETEDFIKITEEMLARWARKGSLFSTKWLFRPGYIEYELDVATGTGFATVFND